jgi:hypothetical protein
MKTTRARIMPDIQKPTATGGIPYVDDVDCAFPSRWRELLPKLEDLTDDERMCLDRDPFCLAVSNLFFSGGKLADHGIFPKPGIDIVLVTRYLRATLGDWGPSHEHKIGGIAHMLKKWCVYKPSKGRKK